jgi:hypothetical protein
VGISLQKLLKVPPFLNSVLPISSNQNFPFVRGRQGVLYFQKFKTPLTPLKRGEPENVV